MSMRRISSSEFARMLNLVPPGCLELKEAMKTVNDEGDFKRTIRIYWQGEGIFLRAVFESSELPNIKESYFVNTRLS